MATTTYQVVLSTDGKHTVIVTTDELPTTENVLVWAQTTYERLVQQYGRKQAGRQRSEQQPVALAPGGEVPECAVHKVPMVRVQGRYGPFWSCHERTENGSFCTYRPPGA